MEAGRGHVGENLVSEGGIGGTYVQDTCTKWPKNIFFILKNISLKQTHTCQI